MNSTQVQRLVGSGTLCATPAGLCSGRVASSEARFHCRAPFWPPNRRSLLPSSASAIAIIVVCSVGRAVVCRTQIRPYRTVPTLPRFFVDLMKTWLQ